MNATLTSKSEARRQCEAIQGNLKTAESLIERLKASGYEDEARTLQTELDAVTHLAKEAKPRPAPRHQPGRHQADGGAVPG